MKALTTLLLTTYTGLEIFSQNIERPNFVWYMTEDLSKHYLKLYNEDGNGAPSPNLEKMAKEGIIFDNAFSNAPVSSAARSTLFTSCYGTRLGISLHRKSRLVDLPEDINMFPTYLRRAGYHTSNASKTDYNCQTDNEAWDIINGKIGDWRKRKDKNQPFFHVRTNAVTHEGHLHFTLDDFKNKKTETDPNSVSIHPIHPDTPLFRYTYATFYDCIMESDRELGKLINMLKEDGELDNTFIFYFGDNGGSLPGTKGYTNELGLNVPLVVYVPEKWRKLLPVKIGEHTKGFVSFVDLGPTIMHLAGIDIPQNIDGTPVLGKDISKKDMESKNTAYCYGDRYDEAYAINRTYRKGNIKYSRNFLPHHPKSLYVGYRYKQAAFREWSDMYNAGKLNKIQERFFLPQGSEELYDLSIDPFETNNLINNPKYSDVLKEMRNELKNKLTKDLDLGFIPECVWIEKGYKDPVKYAQSRKDDIKRYSDLIDLQIKPIAQTKDEIKKALHSEDDVTRYWAATVCASYGEKADIFRKDLEKLLSDNHPFVSSRALAALNNFSKQDNVTGIKKLLKQAKSGPESLSILNDAAYIKWKTGNNINISMSDIVKPATSIEWRIDYLTGKSQL